MDIEVGVIRREEKKKTEKTVTTQSRSATKAICIKGARDLFAHNGRLTLHIEPIPFHHSLSLSPLYLPPADGEGE